MTSASILNVITLNLFPSKDYSRLRFMVRTLCGTAIAVIVMAYLARATRGSFPPLGWIGALAVVAIFIVAAIISYHIYDQHERSILERGPFETTQPEWSYIYAPFFYMVGWLFNAFISVLTFFIVLVWG